MKNNADILNEFKTVQETDAAPKSSRKLKVGIIGTGWIADAQKNC